MKTPLLVLLFVLMLPGESAWASDINLSNLTSQSAFRDFSEDLGAALSYKPVAPPTPLGVTGFDIGVEVTATEMRNLDVATGGSTNVLVAPKVYAYKGLPLDVDVGAFYSTVAATNAKFYGGELRYAILAGGVAEPAIGIRGTVTRLTGVSGLSMNTKGVDMSISKGFAMFTPYAGIGEVWVDSTPDASTALASETSRQAKVFAGGNFALGFANIALEYDKTGSAPSYSAKIGLRF